MKKRNPTPQTDAANAGRNKNIFILCLGIILGICLNKFGNPIILDPSLGNAGGFNLSSGAVGNSSLDLSNKSPSNLDELIYQPWPIEWSWFLFGLILFSGLFFIDRNSFKFKILLLFPCLWLSWQFVSYIGTINPVLSRITLIHFCFCIGAFFLGVFVLHNTHNIHWLWIGLILGFLSALWNGLGQHYGGLEATRQYIYENSDIKKMSPLFLQRLSSNRIFSSFVYPNAFAGAILLLLTPCLTVSWLLLQKLKTMYRGVIVGSIAYIGLACLVWTGSKAGWLIALGLLIILFAHLRLGKQVKIVTVLIIFSLGLAGFFLRYQGYFQKGATSVSARFDYWRAALHTANTHPWLGTGPGTFADSYKKIKSPESEMARLVHNDFLEQACDSGWIGFAFFLGFILSCHVFLYRKRNHWLGPVPFAVWLGLIGFTSQCLVEFGLYIPALAWIYFLLLGWMVTLSPETSTNKPSQFQIELFKPIKNV